MGYRFTEGQIIGFRREAKAEVLIKELFRQHSISDTKRLKELEAEHKYFDSIWVGRMHSLNRKLDLWFQVGWEVY